MHLLLEPVPDLHQELSQLLRQIPCGRVTTYGKVAEALGDAGAARWVGEALVDHPHDDECCCHRVVRVDGDVGLYISRDSQDKIARLKSEKVPVVGGRVRLNDRFFDDFESSAPLARLRELQEELRPTVQLLTSVPKTVAGVDVSYVSATEAVAAYVMLDFLTLEVVWSTTVVCPVGFPYITGYLSFRELPIYASLFQKVQEAGRVADVVFVDGNGILHPRRAGSASCVGIMTGIPTIGVGKKLLFGKVNLKELQPAEPQEILHNDKICGFAMTAGIHNRPFFVSPGHLTGLDDARQLTQQVMEKTRLPRPIMLADRISRDVANVRKASTTK